MESTAKTYKFIGKVLPDGHLSIPEDVAKDMGSEFEVLLRPVDDTKKLISLYLEGCLERTGRFEDILFNAPEVEQAVEDAFGTTDVDVLIGMIRR
jgi:hypothetical protein